MITFLIIRFSSIGDIVLTTPVVRCLKKQVENSRIIYLTKESFKPVIEHNPYIDKKLYYKGNLKETVDYLLNEERIDYVIDLHHNLRSSIVKRKLNLPAFAFKKLNFEKWLMVHFKKNRLPDKHIVDRYLETTKVFDIENDGQGLDYFIDEESSNLPEDWDTKFNNQPFMAMVIGANHFTKQIPTRQMSEIIDAVKQPVVLLGGPADTERAMEVSTQASYNNITNTCGKSTLNQSAYLVQKAHVVVTPDTGLMHIAAAYKKNIVSVWGNTIPEFGMYPYQANNESRIFQVKGLKCRPCSKIGYASCPKKHFNCMEKQDIPAMVAHIHALFTKHKNNS